MNISTTFSALVFLLGTFNAINASSVSTLPDNNLIVMTAGGGPSFYINGKDICVDEDFNLPVTVSDFDLITSFQYTIGWDNNLINFDTISYIAPDLGSTFLFNEMSNDSVGVLTISWYDNNVAGVSIDDLTEIFRIEFTTDVENQTSMDVTFENEPTMKEVSAKVNNDIQIVEANYK